MSPDTHRFTRRVRTLGSIPNYCLLAWEKTVSFRLESLMGRKGRFKEEIVISACGSPNNYGEFVYILIRRIKSRSNTCRSCTDGLKNYHVGIERFIPPSYQENRDLFP